MQLTEAAILVGASVVAGAINAVAGGGTLVSFPAAIAAGLSPLGANATNTVALFPGQFASAYGYRREIGKDRGVIKVLVWPGVVGGVVGSLLLLSTPQKVFDFLVPILVLFATVLLFWQNVGKRREVDKDDEEWRLPKRPVGAVVMQLLVGVYGGYFGAGMGIMLLALYSRMGGKSIHRMNGVKTVISALINAVACVAFLAAGAVDLRAGAVMAVGAIVGGFIGAAGARKVKAATVRWAVVGIGCVLTAVLSYRRYFA